MEKMNLQEIKNINELDAMRSEWMKGVNEQEKEFNECRHRIICEERMEDIKGKEEGKTVNINWFNLIAAVCFLICAGLSSSAQSACIFVGLSIFNLLFVVGQLSIDTQNNAEKENKKLLEEINGKLERLEKSESIDRNIKILRDDASEIQRKL